ncbi:hypothetical protein EEQ99_28650 [Rhizobium anhuiense]|uniref:Uncharacterized protein n=1 Tax=Rhizobium anhuiense TaxID=1184720 RepID=A0A3S0SNK8_9HYPH|nr:hypothetical protein EEQ99_28650 [Rhizobium anhuiense]
MDAGGLAVLVIMPPSEGRLGIDGTVLFGKYHGQLGLGDFEFGFDLAALGGLNAGVQLSAQFLDLLFDHRHLLDV